MKIDLWTEYKELYSPKAGKPELVRVIDRKTYNPRRSGKSTNVVTVEAIEATLPLILGNAKQIT